VFIFFDLETNHLEKLVSKKVFKYMNEVVMELNALQQKYAKLAFENWISTEVLTWSWWFLVAVSILPWFIFFRFLDRNRVLPIWSLGLMVVIITSFTDDLGSELNVWIYPIKLVPVGLLAYPFDFTIIPVAYMLIYQYFNTWKTFNVALVCMALLFAFVGEPISVWFGTVSYLGWKYSYSFVFYILTGNIARAFTQKLVKLSGI
jgi:hypothetical protein